MKVCGITRLEDAKAALLAGADYIGVIVEVEASPRSVDREHAAALLACGNGVALTCDAPLELDIAVAKCSQITALQLAGAEDPVVVKDVVDAVSCAVWKSVHLAAVGAGEVDVEATLHNIDAYATAGATAIVLDTAVSRGGKALLGGTGTVHDWEAAARITRASRVPIVLAGGLTPGNVAEAIRTVAPAAVDVSSGLEARPGVKDHDLIRAFIEAARRSGS